MSLPLYLCISVIYLPFYKKQNKNVIIIILTQINRKSGWTSKAKDMRLLWGQKTLLRVKLILLVFHRKLVSGLFKCWMLAVWRSQSTFIDHICASYNSAVLGNETAPLLATPTWGHKLRFDITHLHSGPQIMACLVPAGMISTTTLPHFPAALGLWRVVLTAASELEERGAVAWQDLASDVLLCFQQSSRNNP